jgi:succinate dehydrogenase / fumarate reductase cytochrome b subunit
MKWIINFFTSTLGQKIIMSLTGLFLISFLLVHLIGNFQLLLNDGGEAFNVYAKFMTNNPVIKFTSYGLYAFIILHTVQGIVIWRVNRSKKGSRYAVSPKNSTWASRKMGILGTIILVFILIHMYQYWLKMKLDLVDHIMIDGVEVKDLYGLVYATYTNIFFVIFYVVSMIVIGLHLSHGFQSAFQTLGLNHKKYTPLIKIVGTAYSILVPLGFAIIPIIMYLKHIKG